MKRFSFRLYFFFGALILTAILSNTITPPPYKSEQNSSIPRPPLNRKVNQAARKIPASENSPEYILYEFLDPQHRTVAYARRLHTPVCSTGECRDIEIIVYWDAVSDYLGYKLPPGKILTKAEHDPFSKTDYEKLDHILHLTDSVLRDKSPDDLIAPAVGVNQKQLDAITGATPADLKKYIVEKAVYTSYTLWHIVYGSTRRTIQSHLLRKTDPSFLAWLLTHSKPSYRAWALQVLAEHPQRIDPFLPEIITLIHHNNGPAAHQALELLTRRRLSDPNLQKQLITLFPDLDVSRKFDLLYKLKQVDTLSPLWVDILINEVSHGKIDPTGFNYIIDFLPKIKNPDPELFDRLALFLDHPNFFLARKTYVFLSHQPHLDPALERKVSAFRDKYRNRLR